MVLAYPHDTRVSVWNGRDLLRIATVLQNIKLDDGKVIETSGLRGRVRLDDPLDPEGWSDRDRRVADRRVDHHLFSMRPGGGGVMSLGTLISGVVLMMGGAGWARFKSTS